MARDPLDIIEHAESKGKNVPNYKFGPGFTAQGYYQITNPTWRDHAKAAGVDLSQYPTAMTAPKEVQRAVAEQIYKKRGFQPWEAVKHLRGQEKDYSVGTAGKREEAPLERMNRPMPTQTASISPTAPASSGSLAGAMGRAMSFKGMNETANADALGKFMAQKGIPFTPQNVAWCAAFVNASLADQGLPTTGSNMARSFLKWGQETKTPNQGDIAVFTRGDPRAATGHVGFYGGTVDRNGQQYIRIFGGNQGGRAAGGGEAGWTELPGVAAARLSHRREWRWDGAGSKSDFAAAECRCP